MWPPLPPDVYLRRPTRDPPFPLAAPDCLVLRKARQALFFGIQGLGLGPGDEVLLPAYHHGSEVEAFLRTGVSCRFYDVDPTLRPDLAALKGCSAHARGPCTSSTTSGSPRTLRGCSDGAGSGSCC